VTPAKDYVGIARKYEADVLDGTVEVCQQVRQAVERNRRDLAKAEAGWLYRFDRESAERVCAFVEMMPHILGDFAKPTILEDGTLIWPTIALEPWQCWVFTTVFGWLRNSDGKRRFRIAFLLVPRKNSKSTMLAALSNYMVTADGEPGAKCYAAATTRDQAKAVAEPAYQMAARLPQYREWFGVKLGAKTRMQFSVPATASSMEPLSADAHTLDGLNIHFAPVDELHAHKTRHVWDVIETATGARSQPLVFPISTAGVEIGGICYELLTYLQKLLDRSLEDETFWGVNYTIDADDDPLSADTHKKANPNYGVSVQPDDLQRKALKARSSPAALNTFLTKHLNVWIRTESSWAPMTEWIRNGDTSLRIEQFEHLPCWVGVDLAEVKDIAALVIVFKATDGTLTVFGRYYLPQKAVAQSPIAQLSGWVRQGHITETDGDQADYARIEEDIIEWCKTYRVQKVCFDRALAAQMGQSLTRKMGAKPEVLTVNQNIDVMNPAMQTVERMILSGKLRHDGNPALTWMMSNVVVQRNFKDEVFPRKAGGKDSPNKIDGPVALFTVIGQVMAEPVAAPALSIHFFGGRKSDA
jgi:phage terminase large subunit-like protein